MTLPMFPSFKPLVRIAFPDDLIEAQEDARHAGEAQARQEEDTARHAAWELNDDLHGDDRDCDEE